MNRFFVGNVAYALDDESFAAELSALSLQPINVRIVKDRDTGNPRGFGFFETEMPVAEVLAVADGVSISGRPIRVAVADKQPVVRTSGGDGGSGRTDKRPSRPKRQHRNHQPRNDDWDWGGNEGRRSRRRNRAW